MRLVTSLLTVGTSVAIGVQSGIRRSPSPVSPSSPIPAHAREVGGKCLLDLDDLEVELSVNKLNRIATKCIRKGTGKLEAKIDTSYYGDNSYTCQELAQAVHDATLATDESYYQSLLGSIGDQGGEIATDDSGQDGQWSWPADRARSPAVREALRMAFCQ
ncbi:hypothetical protein FOZ61_007295 [Perkinsus olseni]|uniref:Uncharacterized protein n=1 Tax=Perkinsus olseni TaxID=32597 RepID=A0A7J6M9B7_PEROL|nr:hypothetical protein FOZ61_007295 [Perkinsus olseni]